MNTKRYFEFDGLRGLLALWVALAHLFCWCGFGRIAGDGKAAKLWSMFTMADAAAETFIILSGFAIATLLQREQVSYGRYMLRRVFRIYPVYVICLGLAIWLVPVTGLIIDHETWSGDFYMGWQRDAQAHQQADWRGHVWSHLLLVHSVLPRQILEGASASLLMPAWSIGLEEQFYLVAPLLVLMLRTGWGRLVVLLLAVVGHLLESWWNNPVNGSLLFWLPYFLVGIGSSHLATWLGEKPERAVKLGGAIAYAALLAAVFLARNPLPFIIWAVVCPVAMGAWQCFAPRLGAVVSWLLKGRAAQWLGEVSYSLYLLHWPLIIMLLGAAHRWRPGMSRGETLGFMLAIGVPVILLLAWALHVVIEKPFMRMGRRLASGDASASDAPVASVVS